MRIRILSCLLLGCCGTLTAAAKPAEDGASRNEVSAVLSRESAGPDSATDRRSLLENDRSEAAAPETWWQSGFLQAGGTWVSFDAPSGTADPVLKKYRIWRAAAAATAADQLKLADRCRDAGLNDQERAHLARGLLAGDASSPERILTRLGYRQVGNQWFTPAELRTLENEFQMTMKAWRKLQPRLEGLALRLEGTPKQRERALAELKSLATISRLSVLEQYLAPSSESAALAIVNTVGELESYRASQTLARLAISSPWKSAQQEAIKALERRPLEHYVPVVLSTLQTPISSRFNIDVRSNDSVARPSVDIEMRMLLAREGRSRIQAAGLRFVDHRPLITRPNTGGAVTQSDVVSVPDDVRAVSDFVYLTMSRAEELNDQTEELNRRAGKVLAAISGEPESANPRTWWNWWDRITGVDWSYDKPVDYEYQEQEVTRPYALFVPGRDANARSCLAAGTPVWTDQGMVAIEKILPGDRVLSKDVETGELAYKPVLHTTRRSDAGLRKVSVQADTFLSSLGHNFWISGEGWKRINQLRTRARAHTVTGTAMMEAEDVEEKGDVFNLIVADFHTYFVGKAMVLSHDVLPPNPTDCLVPGLAP